mgnify:CR=1 FL=1
MIEEVVLVNEKDEAVGTMEKMAAHEQAILHRAFSVFVFNTNGDLLMQQRAFSKYHSGGLWTNTCCSHPRPGEHVADAANRRLQEEMGFVTQLNETTSFIYKAPFANGLTEHELDHIMVGRFDNSPNINLEEVVSWKWMSLGAIKSDIKLQPLIYTEWFKIIFEKFYEHINTANESNSK